MASREDFIMSVFDKYCEMLKTRHLSMTDYEIAAIASKLSLAFAIQGIENSIDSILEQMQEG